MKSYTDGHIQTIESMYVLWRMMGVPKWHERRWSILESIERMPRWSMGMRAWIKWIWSLRIWSTICLFSAVLFYQTWFLHTATSSQMLKYLYLLFDESEARTDPYPLDSERSIQRLTRFLCYAGRYGRVHWVFLTTTFHRDFYYILYIFNHEHNPNLPIHAEEPSNALTHIPVPPTLLSLLAQITDRTQRNTSLW